MNVYIFAIGGTGARVLRSLSFCLASGMHRIPNGTKFIPLIIDYDAENGDKKRAIKNLELYSEIRKQAYNGITIGEEDHNFFMPEVGYLTRVALRNDNVNDHLTDSFEFNFGTDAAAGDEIFSDFMDYKHLSGDLALTKDFLSLFYNDEDTWLRDVDGKVMCDDDGKPVPNPHAELHLELSEGFRGNPNIGSIIFQDLQNSEEFRRFKAAFDPQNDRVFIISSIFGGTGSSGFPRIVDAIRHSGIANYDTTPIGASIVMPYFKVDTPSGGAINSNVFNSKQKAALSYYNKTLFNQLTAAYFVADNNPTIFPYAEGKSDQKNEAHVVEMLAALSVIDFATKSVQTMNNERWYEFGLVRQPGATESIEIKHFDGENDSRDYNTQNEYIDFVTCMALAFRYYREFVLSGAINPKKAYYSRLDIANKLGVDMYYKLDEFSKDFECWLDEMANQKDSFRPYRHTPRSKDNQHPVAENLYDYLIGYDGDQGGVFSDGTSFDKFTSYCNSGLKKLSSDFSNNEDYVFLKLFYDAAQECLNYYSAEQ